MDRRSGAGVVAVLTIAGLVTAGLWGLVAGYTVGDPGALFAPTVATIVLVGVVVGTLVAIGTRSNRRRENPYW